MEGTSTDPASARHDHDGFGLVEIIISMFLLTLISIGFLPLLIDALQTTVRNSTIATATQLVSEQLDAAGQIPRTCAALNAFEGAALPTLTDARGTVFSAHRDAANCPSSGYPLSVNVRVWVTADSDPSLLVESRTSVIIESAS